MILQITVTNLKMVVKEVHSNESFMPDEWKIFSIKEDIVRLKVYNGSRVLGFYVFNCLLPHLNGFSVILPAIWWSQIYFTLKLFYAGKVVHIAAFIWDIESSWLFNSAREGYTKGQRKKPYTAFHNVGEIQ